MVSYDVLIFHEFNSKTHLLTAKVRRLNQGLQPKKPSQETCTSRLGGKIFVMVSCDGFVFFIATKENSHFLCCNNMGQCHDTDLQMGDKFLVSLLFFILSPAAKLT
jgi:hypothetical protein